MKKKKIIYLLILSLILSMLAGCKKSNSSSSSPLPSKEKKKELEYIVYLGDDHLIYRVNPDGSDKTKLTEDTVYGFTIVDNYIYYEKESEDLDEDRTNYRIDIKGKNKEKVAMSFYNYKEADGWIYFDDINDEKLYKMKLNGDEKTVLIDKRSQLIDVVGDKIYYLEFLNDTNAALYRMNKDGSEKNMVMADTFINYPFISISGGWIYFINDSEVTTLYKIKTDGTGRVKLSDSASEINVNGNYIFYSGIDSGLYKIDTDGKNVTKLVDDDTAALEVLDDWVYYLNLSEANFLYRAKGDASKKEKLTEDFVWAYSIYSDLIYYINQNDSKLYSIKLDGTGKKEIVENCAATDGFSQFEFVFK